MILVFNRNSGVLYIYNYFFCNCAHITILYNITYDESIYRNRIKWFHNKHEKYIR